MKVLIVTSILGMAFGVSADYGLFTRDLHNSVLLRRSGGGRGAGQSGYQQQQHYGTHAEPMMRSGGGPPSGHQPQQPQGAEQQNQAMPIHGGMQQQHHQQPQPPQSGQEGWQSPGGFHPNAVRPPSKQERLDQQTPEEFLKGMLAHGRIRQTQPKM